MSHNTPSGAVAETANSTNSTNPAARRRKLLLRAAFVVAAAGIAWGGYEWLVASHYENTDNAYVQGNVVQITPQTAGMVQAILADETDFVRAGQPLVQLDPADARVAFEQAEANLAQTVRQVRTLYADNATLAAQVALREADAVRSRNEVKRAADDLQRRQALAGNGAVSREELSHAQSQLDTARAAQASAEAATRAAREQLASNRALTEGVQIESHPNVQAAAAKLREAYLALQRTALPAPVDGFVAKRAVQVGQRVAPGAALMTVVPLDHLWVDANFKENQLRQLRIGQPVKLIADLYGGKVEYDGHVEGLGVGTGAAFSLLPAQNATGNWIKVVQRVPVRVALDPAQLAEHPLRVGLSMDVTVDVGRQDGPRLSEAPRQQPAAQTHVYAEQDQGADEIIARVIADNAGRPQTAGPAQGAAAHGTLM